MKVSIITSFYNMDHHLDDFLKNVVNQYNFKKNIELIIHLNKASEIAKNIISSYKKKYKNIFPYYSNDLKSLGFSWNFCINKSNNPLVTIWNVDDRRSKKSLYYQQQIFEKKKIAQFVYGNFLVKNKHSKDGKILEKIDVSKYHEDELNKSMILGPFFMFKKNVTKKIGFFDEQLNSALDFDYALRLSSEYNGLYTKKNLGVFLNEKKGLSTSNRIDIEFEKNFVLFRYGVRDKIPTNFSKVIKKTKMNLFFYKYKDKFVKSEKIFKKHKQLLIKNKIKYKKNEKKSFSNLRYFIHKKIYNLKNLLSQNLIAEKEEVDFVLKKINKYDNLNIIDIGSNIGEFVKIFKQYPNKNFKFICIEPNSDLNFYIKFNLKIAKIKNYSLYNVGISDKTSYVNFYLSEFSKVSSFDKSWKKRFKQEFKNYKIKKVQCYTFNDFCKKHEIDKNMLYHLIKIDVEGFDYKVLKTVLASKINSKCIMLEIDKSGLDKIFKIRDLFFKNNYRNLYVFERNGIDIKYSGTYKGFLKQFKKDEFVSANLLAFK